MTFNYFAYVDETTLPDKKTADFICHYLTLLDENNSHQNLVELKARAYKAATTEDITDKFASAAAYKMLNKRSVQKEIDRLKALKKSFEQSMQAEIDKVAIAMKVREETHKMDDEMRQNEIVRAMWTKVDSVNRLVGIVDKCQNTIDNEGLQPKVADTMRLTIETLNRMLGYNEPEKQAVDNTINVAFNGSTAIEAPKTEELAETTDDTVYTAEIVVPQTVTLDDLAG